MFALPQGDLLEFEWLKVMHDISPYTGFKKYTGALRALKLFMMKTKLIEDIENAEGKYTCREANRGDAERVKKDLLQRLDATNTYSKLREFRHVIAREYGAMEKNDLVKPLKAFVTGEIHVFLEPYVNRDIVKKLGRMGCEVTLGLSLYDWILHKFHLNFHRKQMQHLAKPHMPLDIGGEAVWVIGEYIWAANHGYDIFSHIYPFTCMPEITARGIITNKLFKEHDLPPIFVSLDENLAEAGLITRLEAMVELATARRKKQEKAAALSVQAAQIRHSGEQRFPAPSPVSPPIGRPRFWGEFPVFADQPSDRHYRGGRHSITEDLPQSCEQSAEYRGSPG